MNFIIYPKQKMSQKKIYNNQIIKSESNSLSRVGNTLKITNKLLEENDNRHAVSEIKSVKIGNQQSKINCGMSHDYYSTFSPS